jgi:hypothetical protein
MKNGGDYTRKQIARDTQHARDYRAWVEAMNPAERENLRQLGLDEPDTSYHGTGMSERDLADSPLASEEPDIVGQIEPEQPERPAVASEDIDERIMDVLRRLLGEVLTQKNARLTLECLAVACGLTTLQGESMTSIAKRHGISRAAVSKRCVDITEKLSLPPSRAMRSRAARKSYQQAQKLYRQLYERDRN